MWKLLCYFRKEFEDIVVNNFLVEGAVLRISKCFLEAPREWTRGLFLFENILSEEKLLLRCDFGACCLSQIVEGYFAVFVEIKPFEQLCKVVLLEAPVVKDVWEAFVVDGLVLAPFLERFFDCLKLLKRFHYKSLLKFSKLQILNTLCPSKIYFELRVLLRIMPEVVGFSWLNYIA